MARKHFYFDYDYYGVNFYEEEIITEPEKRVTYTASSGSFDDGVIDALNKMPCVGYQRSVDSHCYQVGCNMSNSTEQEELLAASNLAGASEHPAFRIPRYKYKFVPGQLWELRAVFEETHYPDALRRKELANLMNVDEQKVKDWFNNKRAKLRKNQRVAMLSNQPAPPPKDNLAMKNLVESKNVLILQEQVGDGLFWGHGNFDAQAGQDIFMSLLLH